MSTIESLFLSVLGLSLSGGLLALFVLGIRRIGGRWWTGAVLSVAWLLVGLRLLVPLVPESSMSVLNAPSWIERVSPNPASESPVVVEVRPRVEPAAAPKPATLAAPVAPRTPLEIFVTVLACLWLAGVCLLLAGAAIGQARFRRALVEPGDGRERIGGISLEAARRAGLRHGLHVRESEGIESPALCGIFRPLIVLPRGLAETLGDEELAVILQHELVHYRRRDHWLHGLMGIAAMVHWFNPLAWIGLRACREDCELAVDADVVRGEDATRRQVYGEVLLTVTKRTRRPAPALLFQPARLSMAAHGKNLLKRRIDMIKRTKNSSPALRVAGLALLAVGVLFTATGADKSSPKEKNAESATEASGKVYQTRFWIISTATDEGSEGAWKEGSWGNSEDLAAAVRAAEGEIISAPRVVQQAGKSSAIVIGDKAVVNGSQDEERRWSSTKGVFSRFTVHEKGAERLEVAGHSLIGSKVVFNDEGEWLEGNSGPDTLRLEFDSELSPGEIRVLAAGERDSVEGDADAVLPKGRHVLLVAQVTEAPEKADDSVAASEGPRAATKTLSRLFEETVIPEVNFENFPLEDAALFLAEQVRELSGEEVTVKVEGRIEGQPDDTILDRKITLSLREVPASHVLDYLARLVGARYSFNDDENAIVFFPESESESEPEQIPSAAKDREKSISLEHDQENPSKILLEVADQCGLNLVLSSRLDSAPLISLRLSDVSWRQAFDAVLLPIGFEHIERDGILYALTRSEAESMESELTDEENP